MRIKKSVFCLHCTGAVLAWIKIILSRYNLLSFDNNLCMIERGKNKTSLVT